jgi:hypothetical protein
MVIRLGIVGMSDGNGHPFSFSAILNGYEGEILRSSGWEVIANYLDLVPKADFGNSKARVTHVWTQDLQKSLNISDACKVPNVCRTPDEMIGQVDGVIIARDDWQSHYSIAHKFLTSGIPVFIDKPLTLDLDEIKYFAPYLKTGYLMSCSGFRYAKETANLQLKLKDFTLVNATVVNDFEKYGIHMLEALTAINPEFSNPLEIYRLPGARESFLIHYKNAPPLQLTCLGVSSKVFEIDFFGKKENFSYSITDNYNAFKKTLSMFLIMIETQEAVINPNETISLMLMLIAGKSLLPGQSLNYAEFKRMNTRGIKIE